jgi:hypothetical protein
MDWIAAQYDYILPEGYIIPSSCSQSSGSKHTTKKNSCRSRPFLSKYGETSQCNFNDSVTECFLYKYSQLNPPTHSNFFYCENTKGSLALCANDCPGVDPNAVVVGGTELILAPLAAAIVAPSLLGPALGASSILAAIGLGGLSMRNACSPGQCRSLITQRCCRLVPVRGQLMCPSFC